MEDKCHEIDVENFSKLNKLDLLSQYLGIGAVKNKKDTVPNKIDTLSSTYSSYDEYKADITQLFRIVDAHRKIPDKLIDKLLNARKELNLLGNK